MGTPPVLCTALGSDAAAAGLRDYCERTLNMPVLTPATAPPRTAVYAAMLDERGELVAAVADMEAFATITAPALEALHHAGGAAAAPATTLPALLRQGCPLLVVDANVPAATTGAALRAAAAARVPAVFEATSVAKCTRIVDSGAMHLLSAIKPNRLEVLELARAVRRTMGLVEPDEPADAPAPAAAAGASAAGGDGAAEGNASLTEVTQSVDVATGGGGGGGGSGGGGWAAVASRLGGGGSGVGEAVTATVVDPATGAGSKIEATPSPLTVADATAGVPDAEEPPAADSDASDLDYAVLTAAQTVLAAVIRPGGFTTPFSAAVAEEAGIVAATTAAHPPPAAAPAGHAAAGVGFEGRRHVWVTLGKTGLLWLSAPAAATTATADRLLVMPFFAAAAAPDIGMDFVLLPAPPARPVKVTGCGDSLLGAVASSLAAGDRVARALQLGVAAAKVALESEPGASTISPALSRAAVAAVADAQVRIPEQDYA